MIVWVLPSSVAACSLDADRVMTSGRETIGSLSSLQFRRLVPGLLGFGPCCTDICLGAERSDLIIRGRCTAPRAFTDALAPKRPEGHGMSSRSRQGFLIYAMRAN